MLKFDEVNKKIKNDLILLIIESFFIAFLGGLSSYGFLSSSSLVYLFAPCIAAIQTFLLEREIFKYWNNEKEIIFSYHLSIISIFLSSIIFSFLFLNTNLILYICLVLFVIGISNTIFFKYYKGFVDCVVHQMKINNSKQQNGNENK